MISLNWLWRDHYLLSPMYCICNWTFPEYLVSLWRATCSECERESTSDNLVWMRKQILDINTGFPQGVSFIHHFDPQCIVIGIEYHTIFTFAVKLLKRILFGWTLTRSQLIWHLNWLHYWIHTYCYGTVPGVSTWAEIRVTTSDINHYKTRIG